MVTTTKQHMIARGDQDLLARFIAKAELMGIPNAAGIIHTNMAELVSQKVDGTTTVADAHAYAYEVRENYIKATPEPAGVNMGAVTDTHLEAAITALLASQTPPVE